MPILGVLLLHAIEVTADILPLARECRPPDFCIVTNSKRSISMAVAIKSCALAREPLYLQVCELLTRRIADGAWKPNTTLPNEMELAREMGVSTGTVRKALEKLEADRLVVRRQGRDTFVLDQAAPEVACRFDRLRCSD